MAVDGELEVLPGVRLVRTPGHTAGSQVVVIETGGRPIIIAGDTAVFGGELDEPRTHGQQIIRSLEPALVWLFYQHEALRPPTGTDHR